MKPSQKRSFSNERAPEMKNIYSKNYADECGAAIKNLIKAREKYLLELQKAVEIGVVNIESERAKMLADYRWPGFTVMDDGGQK